MKLVLGQSEKSVQQASGNQGREDHNADRKKHVAQTQLAPQNNEGSNAWKSHCKGHDGDNHLPRVEPHRDQHSNSDILAEKAQKNRPRGLRRKAQNSPEERGQEG